LNLTFAGGFALFYRSQDRTVWASLVVLQTCAREHALSDALRCHQAVSIALQIPAQFP
jgi:hypothetical protein